MKENIDHPLSLWLLEQKVSVGNVDLFSVPVELFCGDGVACKNMANESQVSDIVHPTLSAFRCRICQEVFETHLLQQQHFKSSSHVSKVRATLSVADRSLVTAEDVEQCSDDDSSDSDYTFDDDTELMSMEEEPESVTQTIETLSASAEPTFSQGRVRKHNSRNAGLQILFHVKDTAIEFGVSAAVYGVDSRRNDTGSKGSAEENSLNPWATLACSLSYLQSNPYSCLLCLQSGRFAGAVFCGMDVVVHKTFRRYTVRAKAGGAQSSHDKAGRKANSMGAQLRRYGEQALREDVNRVLYEWKRLLDACSVVLVAVPRAMRGRYIYNTDVKDFPLCKSDIRLRDVPFSIPKPTFEEVCVAHKKCMSVSIGLVGRESSEDEATVVSTTQSQATAGTGHCSQKGLPTVTEEIIEEVDGEGKGKGADDSNNDDELLLLLPLAVQMALRDLWVACVSGEVSLFNRSLEAIQAALDEHNTVDTDEQNDTDHILVHLTMQDVLSTPQSIATMTTALHIASENGHVKLVYTLLQTGASPCAKDVRGRFPFFLARNRDTRDAFRRYRATAEDLYDWEYQTGVPSALTDEMLRVQKEKEKEKKKRSKQRKKDDKAAQEELAKREEDAKAAAVLAMQRSCGECSLCGKSLFQSDSYDVFDKKCCSSACVVLMRRRLMAEAAEKRLKK